MAQFTSTAGPRQTKDVDNALRAILREESQHTEIMGTIGGESHRVTAAVLSLGSSNEVSNPKAREEFSQIGEQFGWTITPQNCRAIQAAAIEALVVVKAASTVIDKRRAA